MTKPKTFFGHPIGLATLFFTEMWERFSYYGMRALLLLFMVAPLDKGGMGFNDKTGGAIYGLYTMFVYLLALPGGWLADKFLGLRKSIFYGGCIIALGHFCLAFPFTETFFLGLFFIVTGTGLLKPNISSMVGELYSADEQVHRDNGFSIFYMGINIGGLIAPLICGYLGQKINWHYGFAAAGIGMVLGLIQYKLTEHTLGNAGLVPAKLSDKLLQSKSDNNIRTGLWISGVLILLFVSLLITRVITINPVILAKTSLYVISLCVAIYFIYILVVEKLNRDEKHKVMAISMIFVITAIFYAGYEGQGSSLNLFAERYTNLSLGKTFTMPASWLQAMPSIWIVVCVPLFAILWVWLAKRKLNPATPVKLVLGLLFMGLGYVVMIGASFVVMRGEQPLPTWLVTTYLLHTFGEICLYPIGLSAVTKLSPKHLVGRMMGVFFMALALGNLTSGIFAGEFDRDAVAANPHLLVDLFQLIAVVMLIAAFIVLLAYKPLKKLMGDIH